MTGDACAGDCARGAWRYCPHCGRPLAAGSLDARERRKPTVAELAALRAERRSWNQIAELFGWASPEAVRVPLRKEHGRWLTRSTRLLRDAYEAAGGALPQPRDPGYRHGVRQEDRDAYWKAKREWERAIGLDPLEHLRWQEDQWLAAAVAGDLPGPIPRWPEPA